MSGPTRAEDQVASTNGATGNGSSAAASTAANTAAGAAPSSGRHARVPATSRLQRSASARIPASEPNSRPRQNESRTYSHRPLDLRLVFGLGRAGRVDQGVVVRGQLSIGAVDLRVVEVRLV